MRSVTRILAALLAAALVAPAALAAGRGGHPHYHHHPVFFGSAFYFGAPWYPYPYPAYYYYVPQVSNEPPPVYVEKFEGKPDENSGEIYCPSLAEYYPDVQECPNGWQRIIRSTG